MISRLSNVVAMCLCVALTGVVSAAPPRISNLAKQATFSERERNDIGVYSEYWSRLLANGEPDEVDTARTELASPFKAVQVADGFRVEYARVLLPLLQPVIEGDSAHRAINAVQIAGQLGTPNAVEMILEHASVEDEPDVAIRLWAAISLAVAIDQGVVADGDTSRALRQLERASRNEPNWLVLRRQFEAIASVDLPLSRELQLDVIEAAAAQMKGEKRHSELMQAVYPAVVHLRDEYITLMVDGNRAGGNGDQFGTDLAPLLCELVTVAELHWDSAQGDPDAKQAYGGTIKVSERLLNTIDREVRPRNTRPRTSLGDNWHAGQRTLFHDDHEKWRQILADPPYKAKVP